MDSYDPIKGEIVSRKSTQFSELSEATAISYINEIPKKYPPGTKIADVPSSKTGKNSGIFDSGTEIQGQMILEVPVQNTPISQSILDAADKSKVIIRDINGKIY